MSTIHHSEEVLPTVRYSGTENEQGKSWMMFWLNGVGFTVEVSREDVKETVFSTTWLECLKEPDCLDPLVNLDEYNRRWKGLCDCVLAPCLPMLRELAPSSKQWVTLNDYLHTPSYKLRMMPDETTQDAVPVITEGPKDTPSYEHWPTAAANIKHLPADAPRYQAKDLIALEQGKSWHSQHQDVRAPDGRVYLFKSCRKTAMHLPSERLTNDSINSINMYGRLYKDSPNNVHIPRMDGIVVTESSPDIDDSSPSVGWSSDPRAKHHGQHHHDEVLVAGILLSYPNNTVSLGEVLKAEGQRPTYEQREKWKKQIADAVAFLHARHITVGGRGGADAWHFINQHTIDVGGYGGVADGDAWLNLQAGGKFHEVEGLEEGANVQIEFEEERAVDSEAIEKMFDF